MSEHPAENPRWVGLWWADSIWSSHTPRDNGEAPPLVAEVRAIVQGHRSDQFSLAETIRLLVALQVATDRVLHEVVAQARSENLKHSWRQIGDALGVGRTAAQKRFGNGLSAEHLDYLEYELESAIYSLRDQLRNLIEEGTDGNEYAREDQEEAERLMKQIEILENRWNR
ncbi:hypothetical protein ACFWB3_10585 [[Kitasatospora] papulosa]|uniref:hypothetical protein n=1 Tax=[Kitasatospora] papulosa TaxID=1464011 RepID=UPI003694EB3B